MQRLSAAAREQTDAHPEAAKHAIEDLIPGLEFVNERIRENGVDLLRTLVLNRLNQALRVRNRQVLQQNRIHEREDCDISADAECQRTHSNHSEGRSAAQ